ncbi:GH36-type glycosyl hydrolase domain-containing protein [Photobacterium halotolerans]|uniref:GH36-type glycosyl hydrolase domain-containing protein n=1 Tax=Photobacterium halotolerans TaxID=265726 RepID=UPI000405A7AF|nr:glucoamylase family protein [Photobacterium halotolerans]
MAPASEWLLDNLYLIEEQISTARLHFSKGYSRELPRLAYGPSKGLPRVYDIALTIVANRDGQIDQESLRRFVAAYQTISPLTLGELWAIPIMLRLALIENLRRISARLAVSCQHLHLARSWANQLITTAETDPKNLILVVADMARSSPPMVSPFIAELTKQLQGHGQALTLPLTWIEQRLSELSLTIDQMVRSENQQQAADQVSTSHTIGSLRFLEANDWRDFVEEMSLVNQILLKDCGGFYGAMDFSTRDRYRHVVEQLARRWGWTETNVAQLAVDLAQKAAQNTDSSTEKSHVGYYLIGDGFELLKKSARTRSFPLPGNKKIKILLVGMAHVGAIFIMALLFCFGLLSEAHKAGFNGWQVWLMGGLLLLAGSQLSSLVVNWLTTLLVPPHPLPRMDYSSGLPQEMRTLVVIPSMLCSSQSVESLLETLEVHFLGNRDTHLYFALLTDFTDADNEAEESDDELLNKVVAGIEALNSRYSTANTQGNVQDRFFLFHRPRRWNPVAMRWMGYERKRGKLADLNLVLRGGGIGAFSRVIGHIELLPSVRYVITLDADTQLPRDSARQLVATMAHPLNRPQYNKDKRIVSNGYGILQPRMAASLLGTYRSRYAQLFSLEAGIDPYTRAVSDVYQDLYGEGSFVGKGIYDVDAFEYALKERFPENRILSHDLLEGCYIRSGLLSDVQLYDDYSATYFADVQRQERWIRGDWQIAQWLLPWVPVYRHGYQRNPLSALSRWKIFDNLRRSLIPSSLLLLLLLGWFGTPDAWLWSFTVVGILILPGWLMAGVNIFRCGKDIRLGYHLFTVLRSAGQSLIEIGFKLACLPYEASFSFGAIIRSIYRLLVAKERLLDWVVSCRHTTTADVGFMASYRKMAIAPLLAMLCFIALLLFQPSAFWAVVPILLLWLLAPSFAWWLSRPAVKTNVQVSQQQTIFLGKIARKTWAFFETFVTADDNWLPPDNYQERPGPILAHRTSPTNIGLSLLANLTAMDFGFIGCGELLRRTQNTFRTLAKLERYQGHFCNWYDTQTLQPLLPRYISSVDSGNLAAHLLTLRAGLQNLPENPLIPTRVFQGLADTLALLEDALTAYKPADTQEENKLTQWKLCLEDMKNLLVPACQAPSDSLEYTELHTQILLLITLQKHVEQNIDASEISEDGTESEIHYWAMTFQHQCQAFIDELQWICPWLKQPVAMDSLKSLALLNDLVSSGKLSDLNNIQSLRDLVVSLKQWLAVIDDCFSRSPECANREELTILHTTLMQATARANERMELCENLASLACDFATMEYHFLYDKYRHLLSVGYNIDEFRRDNSYYDLLASEARLATFVAIAQGKLPQESWFALGHLLTTSGGVPTLISWSGSMFEYLMPLLVMPTYHGTLLDQTYNAAVKRQIAYGNIRSIPWGVSESGFSSIDANQNYQYHAFGVPGLGLKRGLAEDSVIAPYASALALMVDPHAACANLQRLSDLGCEGRYGFYEAIDYTPARMTRGRNHIIVRSFMAHHQGMSLLALGYVLLDQPMQKRFESDLSFQATLLLLQEKIPKSTIVHTHVAEHSEGSAFFDEPAMPLYRPIDFDTRSPEVQLLSNGRYHVMLTNVGGGYSRCNGVAVTRWREDPTCDNWGAFVYLRDPETGNFWSATYQPTLKKADRYAAMFSEGRAEFRRNDHDFETYSEIVVSPEDDIELRRLRITNRSSERRMIEITSYAEVVLSDPAADERQTAFNNLFIQTEIVSERCAILCSRRPRSGSESPPWMFHLLSFNGAKVGDVSYETDRTRFIGRGNTLVAPQAISGEQPLSNSQGSVLDPIVAIRCSITLESEESATIDLVTGVAINRKGCLALVDKYQDRHFADRVFDLASTHSTITLRQINASETDALLYRRLANTVLYNTPALRADASILIQNRRGQAGLWGYSISGDLPIVLLRISDISNMKLVNQLIQCHAYWRLKGLAVDLVIWNEDNVGYRKQIQDQILGLIATCTEAHEIDRPGGIFVRGSEQISDEDKILLQAVSCAILTDRAGTFEEQVNRRDSARIQIERLASSRYLSTESHTVAKTIQPDLILSNALGGFTEDGNEYCITTTPKQTTPLPWVNVLANANFGSVITESGLAYTWSENAHEFRLTPWSNDAIGASSGEAFYLRDEDSGKFWSPTPLPCQGQQAYIARHGFGYSTFEHVEWGIHSTLMVYVHLHDTVKFSVLTVRNDSDRRRRISATGYVEWVLGDLRAKSSPHIVTEIDPNSGALFARNSYNTDFAGRVAFFDVDDMSRSLTADRTEFIGRNGSLAQPDALTRARLSGRVGAALDPCGAIQVSFDLLPGQGRAIIFRLGAGRDLAQARDLALRLRKTDTASTVLENVKQYWKKTLGVVQVVTPDPALNVLANGWLLYQTLACRLWARSGFYQSGGAFGFRDQLQDVMALVHAEPALVRDHLLRAAARQYLEGDVQHWWHPPLGSGVRTRCSDDYLWLPMVTCHYVKSTGDKAVLDINVPFIKGRQLNCGEESYYGLPERVTDEASLYEHCVRAIENGLNMGEYGLPLMGSGDWNDGMNLVGIHGTGESVWLGFFLHKVLLDFADLALQRGDGSFAVRCQQQAAELKQNLNKHGWDGGWYRRAYFDDGTALGSAKNTECTIDSISQSWSVLSNAGTPERSQLAMNAVDEHLVQRKEGLVQLLAPPFDKSALNPGYIKGYVPGVRENGGQYTHAAIWVAMAFAELGNSTRAWEILGLINPVNHGRSTQAVEAYKAEPYVVAADVYAVSPHIGRGGWSWYTGSAGWLYRLILESLLGVKRDGNYLLIKPCLPSGWTEYTVRYHFGSTEYNIVIVQHQCIDEKEKVLIKLDGQPVDEKGVLLLDDRQPHRVDVSITRDCSSGNNST